VCTPQRGHVYFGVEMWQSAQRVVKGVGFGSSDSAVEAGMEAYEMVGMGFGGVGGGVVALCGACACGEAGMAG
jgi:hypothetical protein